MYLCVSVFKFFFDTLHNVYCFVLFIRLKYELIGYLQKM